jgi:hypothetical protein
MSEKNGFKMIKRERAEVQYTKWAALPCCSRQGWVHGIHYQLTDPGFSMVDTVDISDLKEKGFWI